MSRAIDSQELLQVLIRWSIAHLPGILLLVLLAIFVSRAGRRILRRFQQRLQAQDLESGRTAQRSATLAAVLSNLLIAVVWSIAVMQILGELGIAVGPVLAGAGIAGVALGFGAQSLVRDFLTGFFVLLEDQYRVGDTVEVEGATGVVERFTLRMTSIRSLDGSLHHVSNGQINKIKNSSAGWARAIVDIRASHNERLSKLTEALERAGNELAEDDQSKDLVVERPRVMGVEDFSDSQIAVRVAVSTLPGQQLPAARAYREKVKSVFEEMDIELAAWPSVLVRSRGQREEDKPHREMGRLLRFEPESGGKRPV